MSIQDCKQDMLRIGVDVGSTTVKLLVLDPDDQIVFSVYRRHHSDVRATIVEIIDEALEAVGDGKATITITGSGGLLLANWLGVPFVQGSLPTRRPTNVSFPLPTSPSSSVARTRRSFTSMAVSSSA